MKSGLDMTKLGNIWIMSDLDQELYKIRVNKIKPYKYHTCMLLLIDYNCEQDGMLNLHEFTIAMHLTYGAVNGADLPSELPADLANPAIVSTPADAQTSTPAPVAPMGASIDYTALSNLNAETSGFSNNLITPPTPQNPTFPMATPMPAQSEPQSIPNFLTGLSAPVVPPQDVPFCVTPEKYQSYLSIFSSSCDPSTGVISAMDARNVFLQSGLPNPTLAQVWNLADSTQKGSLNQAEFILSMHLLAAVIQGYELPQEITEHMTRAAEGNFSETDKMRGQAVIQQNVAPQVDPELQQLQNGKL